MNSKPGNRSRCLAIFDVDGTLTRTTGVDGACYLQALRECFGIEQVNSDWSVYRHTTDIAILTQIFEERFERAPTEQEIATANRRLVELLETVWTAQPHRFAPVGGARQFLAALQKMADWDYAFATGASAASARFKLDRAGIEWRGLPFASSEDGPSRERIVTTAAQRCDPNGLGGFDHIVSIGDGIWDVRTAARLGLPFVGVAEDSDGSRLQQAGALHVLENYLDLEHTLGALQSARPPRQQ